MGEFPSGQRGQTVNLLSSTSMVRIHLPPPKNIHRFAVDIFFGENRYRIRKGGKRQYAGGILSRRGSRIHLPCRNGLCFVPIFLQKNRSHASSFLLFREKARSARLFACKRAHNGALSLPPFCDIAPSAQRTLWFAFPQKNRYRIRKVICKEL